MEIGIQWPLVLFTLIAGAGFGLLATAGLAQLAAEPGKKTKQIALIGAIVLLGVGGLMSVFHLAHPERFMGAIANLLSFSGIALELLGLAFGGVAALVFLLVVSMENKAGEKVLAVCSILIGVAASFLQGYAYFEVAAQPGWHQIALAFGYLFTSLALGALAYAAIAAGRAEDEAGLRLIGKVACGLAVLAVVADAVYAAGLGGAGLLEGDAVLFAVLSLAFALVTAGAAAWFAFKAPALPLAVAGVLAGVGGALCVRLLMWAVAAYQLNFIWEATVNRGLYLF